MKIVTIDKSLMLKYAGDPEILQKDNRPCVLIVRLKYKGKVIPFKNVEALKEAQEKNSIYMLENSKAKLAKKNADMIVANNLKVAGAGFGTDTNVVTLITEQEIKNLPLLSKQEVADEILTKIQTL